MDIVLENVLGNGGEQLAENFFPLSPLQQGMLAHSLGAPSSGMYIVQPIYQFLAVDKTALQLAINYTILRHSVLRTSYHLSAESSAHQSIQAEVTCVITVLDWSSEASPTKFKSKLRNFLAEDRAKDFNFEQAPLLRPTLILGAEERSYLIMTHHHILLDGLSSPIVRSDLIGAYNLYRKGLKPAKADAVCFSVFLKWLSDRDSTHDTNFWKNYLENFEPLDKLPYDRKSSLPYQASVEFDKRSFTISSSLCDKLTSKAKSLNASQNVPYLAALFVVFAKYTNKYDLVIGMLFNGRPPEIKDVDKIVGMFMNTLPVRYSFTPEHNALKIIEELHVLQNTLSSHQYTSLINIQEQTTIKKGEALFDCIIDNKINLTKNSKTVISTSSEISKASETTMGKQSIPFHINLESKFNEIVLTITFDVKRFKSDDIVRFGKHYVNILHWLSDDSITNVASLCLLDHQERVLLDSFSSSSIVPLPTNFLLQNFVTNQASISPDSIAVKFRDSSLSYSELCNTYLSLSSQLLAKGVNSGSVVCLYIDRCLELPILILALLNIGAVYIPIDPTAPPERITYIYHDAQSDFILASLDNARNINIELNKIIVEDLQFSCNKQQYMKSHTGLTQDSAAYILYTSGSTGQPKGIIIPHRVAISRILSETILDPKEEIIFSKTSHAFVDFIWELFFPWSKGLCCVLATPEALISPYTLITELANSGTRRITLVPSLLRIILNSSEETIEKVSHLKTWVSTGEMLTAELVNSFYDSFPNSNLYNLYGSSEAWDSSISFIKKSNQLNPISSGKTLPNTQIFVLDDFLQLCPIGIAGTIYISGSHLPIGYLNDDNLNKQKFIQLSYNSTMIRCWNTGDVGLWSSYGELIIVGRLDNLVKIKGLRIDITEIESLTRKIDDIDEAAVLVNELDQIILFYQSSSQKFKETVILSFLAIYLPRHMLPSNIIRLESFPLLHSGKIDRKKLIERNKEQNHTAPKALIPDQQLTYEETFIIELFSTLFRGQKITLTSNFFQLGGHSLMAVRLASKIAEEFSFRVSLEKIFEYPVIEDLARWIATSTHEDAVIIKTLTSQNRINQLLPLSSAQKRLWIIDQLSSNKNTYILSSRYSVNFLIEYDLLQDSLEKLVERHQSLRTSFVSEDGHPYQIILNNLKSPIEFFDTTNKDTRSDHFAATEKFFEDHSTLYWDLEKPPLFRLRLIQFKQHSELILHIHHIISDGVSINIFISELLSIYQSLKANKEPNLPKLDLQYSDYALWQNDQLTLNSYSDKLSFWSILLKNHNDILKTPNTRILDSKKLPSYQSIESTISIGPRITQKIRTLARSLSTTTFNVILSIFSIFLSRHSGQSHVCIGSPITGRNNEALQRVIGFFVNVSLYPIVVDENLSFEAFLASIATLSLDIYKNQDVQFESIVDLINPDRDENNQPLFQSMIVHENLTDCNKKSTGVQQKEYTSTHSNFDILLLVREKENSIDFTLHCRSSLITQSYCNQMIRRLKFLTSKILMFHRVPISNISMLPTSEYKKIVNNWNQTEVHNPYSLSTTYDAFKKLVAESPDHISVVDNGVKWTRSDVLNLTSSIASGLRASGVLPGMHIGLLLTKSVKQVSAMLAIHKLGACFVPINIADPKSRIDYIISTSECKLLLVDNDPSGFKGSHIPLFSIEPYGKADVCKKELTTPCQSIPSSSAYISFTSGSTGVPKGVLISQFNLMSLFHAHSIYFLITPNSRVLSTLGFYFDAGIGEQVRALLSGSTLFFEGDNILSDHTKLINALKSHKITHVGIPPAVLQELPSATSSSLPHLKVLITAGEKLSSKTAFIWGSKRTIITGHGATETTIGDTIAVNWNLSGQVPLGRPLPNIKTYVVDQYNSILPPFVPGELLISGAQVSSGYYNEPEKTAKSFGTDIFSPASQQRLYRTGDIVFYDDKGILFFSGRSDFQIKIRGYRIEVAEVEASVNSFRDDIKSVVWFLQRDQAKTLVCYFCSSYDVDHVQLRDFISNSLPSFMVPSFFQRIDKFPCTSNGKIDYASLPPIDLNEAPSLYFPPTSKTEIVLQKLWDSLLGIKNISIRSNFFGLGGDSILLIRMISAAEKQGLRFSATEFFHHQTIRELSFFIDSKASSGTI